MDRSAVIKLIGETFTQDSIGQYTATESQTEVFCAVKSVSQSEYYEAGRNGLQPAFVFICNRWEYSGEKIVEYNSKRYGVYRTYMGKGESIELYCEEKGGLRVAVVNNGSQQND